MDYGLQDKVVLITGGSRGIGKATAKKFANEGADVFITYVQNKDKAQQTIHEIQEAGGRCQALQMDLLDQTSINQAVKELKEVRNRLDVLVNNAGIGGNDASIENSIRDTWFSMIDLNLKGTYLITKAILPIMKQNKWGRIIHISSSLASDGQANGTAYTASKAALHGFSKSLSLELAADGIYSNIVMPGLTQSEWLTKVISEKVLKKYAETFPTKRLGIPEDVANLIVYLGSMANSFINGEAIRVSGGK
ncbi:acetoacetyl-CoA reductase/3-oxoacyl-[acyl-carrier protein] reductase [Seinonella peptonophila]|uniref:Acetoacetyl-CoA reductase/3-oxoacyl-[acyl-carrier protein] reductase n=1 Tax=Seinonella peptonophila TaxID=112248 RepID=A0A1M4X2E1_9BACL|nr:3-oxoacyl-ACP reductase family protein [Seinonella peptonophila]SHE87645.1 acetoacetyl-CoA reductase/3-oxoacyl-[acyl-carrier protein] reductase [Seinonella peptonophila]